MEKYKAIILDLDGTLTNDGKEVTPRTLDALMQVQRKGVKVILASGRPVYGIRPVAEALRLGEHGGYVLAYNGGKIVRWKDGEILFNQSLDKLYVDALYAESVDEGFPILVYQGDHIGTTDENSEYVHKAAFINKMTIEQYDNFPDDVVHPVNKCLILGEPQRLEKMEDLMRERMKGRVDVYRSQPFFLECVPVGIDKSASLRFLLGRLGISVDEVVACGDAANDLCMIEMAGLGVAMANAIPAVKEKADYVTSLNNNEDGIAEVVEKFLL